MVELVDKTFVFGLPAAIYAVPTVERGTVYMRVDGSDETAVVIVDSDRFLDLWRCSKEPLAQQTPAQWKRDYKIEGAENGFSRGQGDPVPVIHVSYFEMPQGSGRMQIGFSNGYTRTIWLLAHGACGFPVKCSGETAQALHAAAGAAGSSPTTIKDLLAGLSWQEWLSRQSQ